MEIKHMPIGSVHPNPENPRVVRDEQFRKLKKSLQEFPEMLEARTLVVVSDGDGYVVLGGNQRLKALTELGVKTVPVFIADHWPVEKRREFVIKDNVSFGEWDWDQLANEWDAGQLSDWGLDAPGFDIDAIEPPALSDADKPEFQQMTFTLHDTQAEAVKAAMDKAKTMGAGDSDVNENSNGNALAYVCAAFLNG